MIKRDLGHMQANQTVVLEFNSKQLSAVQKCHVINQLSAKQLNVLAHNENYN